MLTFTDILSKDPFRALATVIVRVTLGVTAMLFRLKSPYCMLALT